VKNKDVALRLGLTGGIGSGKSTVAALFSKIGAAVIDADAISRAATAVDGRAIDALSKTFGPSILMADGALDRDQMRTLIFSDPLAKARLEQIIHPFVAMEIADQARRANRAGARCIVFDIPLLVESRQWRTTFDRVLVVDCSKATQIHRVNARNGLSADAIEEIIGAQASRLSRLKAADLVVFNEGITIADLAQHVQEISRQFEL
jgi:dephospho-CoA kinase